MHIARTERSGDHVRGVCSCGWSGVLNPTRTVEGFTLAERDAREHVLRAVDLVKHQPREHAVPCRYCGRPTWQITALCDEDCQISYAADAKRVADRVNSLR